MYLGSKIRKPTSFSVKEIHEQNRTPAHLHLDTPARKK